MSDAEKGRLIDAIVTYAESGETEQLNGAERHIFPVFREQINRDNADYSSSVENGKKGGRPKKVVSDNNLNDFRLSDNNLKNQDKEKDKEEDKEKEKDNDYIPPKPPKKALIEEQFDQFWAAYPKKQSKADARKAFVKAMKLTTLDRMLQAIEEQKNSRQWNEDGGKYIPFPATWLNRANYENELTPENTPRLAQAFVPTTF